MRDRKKKIDDFMERHNVIYSSLMVSMVICWLALNGAAPFIMRSVVLPVFYRERQITGIIEEKGAVDEEYVYMVRTGTRKMDVSYLGFYIEDYWVRVPVEDYDWYEVGNMYSFYVYSPLIGHDITNHEPYHIGTGLILLLLLLSSWAFWIWTLVFDKSEEVKEKNRAKRKEWRSKPFKIKVRFYIWYTVIGIVIMKAFLYYFEAASYFMDLIFY